MFEGLVDILLIGVTAPLILFTFMIVFQSESYQYWGDKYHAVLSAQYLFSRLNGSSLITPLWRDDILGGNIWLVSLGTVPFMIDIIAARVFQLSPFGIDLVSNLLGYGVAVTGMYLYLSQALFLTRETAALGAVLFSASGYILSVWTGCGNDFLAAGLLPLFLVFSHRLATAIENEPWTVVIRRWISLAILVYLGAAASSLKTLPILLTLTILYVLFVLRTRRTVFPIILAVSMGLILYSPWLWLYWDAARISQRVVSSFVPPAHFDMGHFLQQALVLAKRVASGFNVYGLSIPVALVLMLSIIGDRDSLKRQWLTRPVLRFSLIMLFLCLVTDAYASQINHLKKDVPLLNGFDVVRFEWFGAFFTLASVALIIDKVIFQSRPVPQSSTAIRIVIAIGGILFAAQAIHVVHRSVQLPTVIHPQNIILLAYLFLYIAATSAVLLLTMRVFTGGTKASCRLWSVLISLSVLFQASTIGYRHGVDTSKRTNADEPIMTYSERFTTPVDLDSIKRLDISNNRVVDLTRPYNSVLSTAAVTALPLAGLRIPGGWNNLIPSWYEKFIAYGINGLHNPPSRLVEVQPGTTTNFEALKLLAVQYVLASDDGLVIPGYHASGDYKSPGKVLYAADAEVSSAFLSPGYQCVPTDREALEAIHAADYKTLISRAILVSSDGPARQLCLGNLMNSNFGEMDHARVRVTREIDKTNIEIETETGGILTASDTYYPGWHGFIDGVEVPVLRTYTTLKGVLVGPGYHRIEFVFYPETFWRLMYVSNLLLLALASVMILCMWGKASSLELSRKEPRRSLH